MMMSKLTLVVLRYVALLRLRPTPILRSARHSVDYLLCGTTSTRPYSNVGGSSWDTTDGAYICAQSPPSHTLSFAMSYSFC